MTIRSHTKLQKWPPDWGGYYGKGDRFLIGDSEGTFKSALVRPKHIEVQAEFQGRDQVGRITSEDQKLLERVCEIMNQNKGKPLKEVGDLEVGS